MAKDPAMLWYWGDWHSGTSLMSRFLKGCYMDLLHAQFNNGPLSLDEVKTVLGSDFNQSWAILSKKFSVSPEGLFFNERLECEKLKRKKFVESRSNNKAGRPKKSYDLSYENHTRNHMIHHMENENRNINSLSSTSILDPESVKGRNEQFLVPKLMSTWVKKFPAYPKDEMRDFEALRLIAAFIGAQLGVLSTDPENHEVISEKFEAVCRVVSLDEFWREKSLSAIEKNIQEFYAKSNKSVTPKNDFSWI